MLIAISFAILFIILCVLDAYMIRSLYRFLFGRRSIIDVLSGKRKKRRKN